MLTPGRLMYRLNVSIFAIPFKFPIFKFDINYPFKVPSDIWMLRKCSKRRTLLYTHIRSRLPPIKESVPDRQQLSHQAG